ncbi:fumarate hydratase [Chloroflexota bacterium]
MREISAAAVAEAVARLFRQANITLGEDVLRALKRARDEEESPAGREVITKILENATLATREEIPLCQDCGVAVVFLNIGQEVHISGGELCAAVDEGVRRAYQDGYLRKSIVQQPFSVRGNTGDNTPAVIHTEIVPGDRLEIIAMPKGAGAENMTRLVMLTPAQGRQGIIDFVVETMELAGSNPCPPVIIGIGIGGTAEKTMLLAKKALLRNVGKPSPDAEIAELEKEILERVNHLGIGPMGYGGRITALAVHAEAFPAHIGGLPVAVNVQCHCDRHQAAVL